MIWRYWPATDPLPDLPPVAATDLTDADLGPEVVAWLDAGASQVCPEDRSRHRSSMVRWHVLYERGGVWADHGATPRLGETFCADHMYPCTCVLGLPAGHPVARAMLDRIARTPDGNACASRVSGWRAFGRVVTPDVLRMVMPYRAGHRLPFQPCSGT